MKFDRLKHLDKASALSARGKVTQAIALYREVVARDSKDANTWLKLAELCRRERATGDAADAYLAAARAFRGRGFGQKAAIAVEQALKLRSGANEHLDAAAMYRDAGQHGDARRHLVAAAEAFHKDSRERDLVGALEQLVELDDTDIQSRYRLAEAYARAQRFDDAVVQFTELAEQYVRIGEPTRALQTLRYCYRAQPENTDLLALMARAFGAAGRPDKVAAINAERDRLLGVAPAPATAPAATPARLVPAELARGTAREPARRSRATQIGQLFNEAVAYIRGGERDRAIPLLRAILSEQPNHDAARLALRQLDGDTD